MKKALVTGTFDIIHEGHLDFFRQAREHGDHLTVVVSRDETVEKVKGESPWNSEEERLGEVRNSELVDKAVLGNLGDKYKVIEEEEPDVVCLGYDQRAFTADLKEKLSERGLSVEVMRLEPHRPERYKSSKIKENIKNRKDNS